MVFSLTPYVVTMTKKASICAAMRLDIEQKGGKFVPTSPLWYISSPKKEKCDFHVFYDDRVISAKILTFYSAKTVLNFIDKKNLEYATFTKKQNAESPDLKFTKIQKNPYDFKFKLPDEWKKLPHANVILIPYPFPEKITLSDGSFKKPLSVAYNTGEGELYSIEAFKNLF